MSESEKLRDEFRRRLSLSWDELEGKKTESENVREHERDKLMNHDNPNFLCRIGLHSWEFVEPKAIHPFQDVYQRCRRCDIWQISDVHAASQFSLPQTLIHLKDQTAETQRKLLNREW